MPDKLRSLNWRQSKAKKNNEKIFRGGGVVPDEELNQNDSSTPEAGKVILEMSEAEREKLKKRILLLEQHQENTGISAHQDTIFYKGEQIA